jgi:DNA-binding NarL/FixJ family response regulator
LQIVVEAPDQLPALPAAVEVAAYCIVAVSHHPLPPQAFPDLTEREREILGLIAQGHNNAEIAQRLALSSKTVANHVSNILGKLQVADRAQAIVRAREAGFG